MTTMEPSFFLHGLNAVEPSCPGVLAFERRLLGDSGGRPPDMEGPHRELSSWFPNRLCRDHPGREAELDEPAGRKVATVATAADAAPCGTGKHRTNLDFLGPRLLDLRGQIPL